MKKKFKTSRTLVKHVINVMTRRMIDYEILEENGEIFILTDISGGIFHKIVIRAKMEKLQDEKNLSIPCVADVELDDRDVMLEVGSAYCLASELQ